MKLPSLAVVWVAGVSAATLTAASLATGWPRRAPSLDSHDVAAVRRQALQLFPVGAPIEDAVAGLEARGMACGLTRRRSVDGIIPVASCLTPDGLITIELDARDAAITDFVVHRTGVSESASVVQPDPHLEDGLPDVAVEAKRDAAAAAAFKQLIADDIAETGLDRASGKR